LFEDNGGFTPELVEVELTWDNQKEAGNQSRKINPTENQFKVVEWRQVLRQGVFTFLVYQLKSFIRR